MGCKGLFAAEEEEEEETLQSNSKGVVEVAVGVGDADSSCFFFCHSTKYPYVWCGVVRIVELLVLKKKETEKRCVLDEKLR